MLVYEKEARRGKPLHSVMFDLEELVGLRLRAHHEFARVVPLEVDLFATSERGEDTRSGLEKAVSDKENCL